MNQKYNNRQDQRIKLSKRAGEVVRRSPGTEIQDGTGLYFHPSDQDLTHFTGFDDLPRNLADDQYHGDHPSDV